MSSGESARRKWERKGEEVLEERNKVRKNIRDYMWLSPGFRLDLPN
jgi:hypothetical protein